MKYPKTTWEIDSIIPYRTNRWGENIQFPTFLFLQFLYRYSFQTTILVSHIRYGTLSIFLFSFLCPLPEIKHSGIAYL